MPGNRSGAQRFFRMAQSRFVLLALSSGKGNSVPTKKVSSPSPPLRVELLATSTEMKSLPVPASRALLTSVPSSKTSSPLPPLARALRSLTSEIRASFPSPPSRGTDWPFSKPTRADLAVHAQPFRNVSSVQHVPHYLEQIVPVSSSQTGSVAHAEDSVVLFLSRQCRQSTLRGITAHAEDALSVP